MTAPALESTVKSLLASSKGILAADESFPTIEKRFKALNISSTEENRGAYREMLFTTPGLSEFISGVILFDETVRQRMAHGVPIALPVALTQRGMIPGIKVDTKDARARGETEQRIYALNAWRETPFFTEKERAALAWAEAVTQVSASQVSDEVYEIARQCFDEKELVNITIAIIAINGWNRLAVSFRSVPGVYEPPKQQLHRD